MMHLYFIFYFSRYNIKSTFFTNQILRYIKINIYIQISMISIYFIFSKTSQFFQLVNLIEYKKQNYKILNIFIKI